MIARLLPLLVMLLTFPGCVGRFASYAEENDANAIAAAPLCEDVPSWITDQDKRCKNVPALPTPEEQQNDSSKNKRYIAGIVNESQFLCGKFVNSLVISAIGVNGDLDLLTTVLSALGTAFTPISTVHAFTAAASISSGWKSAINSDVFAQANIAIMLKQSRALITPTSILTSSSLKRLITSKLSRRLRLRKSGPSTRSAR